MLKMFKFVFLVGARDLWAHHPAVQRLPDICGANWAAIVHVECVHSGEFGGCGGTKQNGLFLLMAFPKSVIHLLMNKDRKSGGIFSIFRKQQNPIQGGGAKAESFPEIQV